MKIKYDHWFAPMIPFYRKKGWVYGKSIFGNLYFSFKEEEQDKYGWLIKHELTHYYQQQSDTFFWVKYVWQWLINTIKLNGNIYQAYLDISYEKEARGSEKFPLTIEERKLIRHR